jgi:hypothetical protein
MTQKGEGGIFHVLLEYLAEQTSGVPQTGRCLVWPPTGREIYQSYMLTSSIQNFGNKYMRNSVLRKMGRVFLFVYFTKTCEKKMKFLLQFHNFKKSLRNIF